MSVVWGWAFCGTSQLLGSRVLLRLRANGVTVILAFDCAMPSANRYDLDKPNVDTVILQNNTVSINAEAPVSFVTDESSSLKYVDTCLSGDDSRDVKRVSALCDSGAEIYVAYSSVVEGLN